MQKKNHAGFYNLFGFSKNIQCISINIVNTILNFICRHASFYHALLYCAPQMLHSLQTEGL